MKILFYDTETTGIPPSMNRRFDNIERYPWLLQISAILYDENGEKLKDLDYYVQRKKIRIENSHIHGITLETLEEKGKPIGQVLQKFEEICSEANLIVCHNYAFDSTIVHTELRRNKIPDFLSGIPSFCTMTECSSLSRGISLQNLHYDLFEKRFENHHNSLYDTQATANCFFEMIKKGWLVKKDDTYHYVKKPETYEFDLDPTNTKFYNAFSIINESKKNIFLTGKAGSGKTTFLKYLRQKSQKANITLAYTGVAAINAGGQTINSFFQLDFRPFLPDDNSLSKENIYSFLRYTTNKREIIEKLELLIIDEVSMVKADTIDAIDKILRIYRKKESVPFGGVQVIFIGDLFQLPPIEGEEWKIVSEFYDSPYFFDSRIVRRLIEQNELVCIELDKVYRQTEIEFINILNRIRVGNHTEEDLDALNEQKLSSRNMNHLLADNYIVLTTTNASVNAINDKKLAEIDSPVFVSEGITEGDFPDHQKIAPQHLALKTGAQVMLLKNTGRNYNGKIGKVTTLTDNFIEVIFDGEKMPVRVEMVMWENVEYTYNKEKHIIDQKVKGQYIQFPLKLAWAITVHKSQGLTFNKVIADVSGAFASGQVYVALSRCTSLSNLKLIGALPPDAIKIDRRVINFSKNQTPDTIITDYIKEGKTDKLYAAFRKLLFDENADDAFARLEKAVKFRNDIFSSAFMYALQEDIEKYNNYQQTIKDLSNAHRQMADKDENTALSKSFVLFEDAMIPLKELLENARLELQIRIERNASFLKENSDIKKDLNLAIEAIEGKHNEFDKIDEELKALKTRWLS